VIVLFHLSDILFTLAGGFHVILWLVLLISLVHFGLLGQINFLCKPAGLPKEELLFEP
jgi:hypothetical protein